MVLLKDNASSLSQATAIVNIVPPATMMSTSNMNGVAMEGQPSSSSNESSLSAQDVVLNEPRLLPHVLAEATKQAPDQTIGMIPRSTDISKGFLKLTLRDLTHAVDYMAYWIQERVGENEFEPIAYLGINDFRYWIMELAAIKCGHPILLPSARNSDSQNLPLFNSIKCTTLFYSQPFESRTSRLRQAGIDTHVVPSFEAMISAQVAREYPYNKSWEEARLDPILICHTSGSTGKPYLDPGGIMPADLMKRRSQANNLQSHVGENHGCGAVLA